MHWLWHLSYVWYESLHNIYVDVNVDVLALIFQIALKYEVL